MEAESERTRSSCRGPCFVSEPSVARGVGDSSLVTPVEGNPADAALLDNHFSNHVRRIPAMRDASLVAREKAAYSALAKVPSGTGAACSAPETTVQVVCPRGDAVVSQRAVETEPGTACTSSGPRLQAGGSATVGDGAGTAFDGLAPPRVPYRNISTDMDDEDRERVAVRKGQGEQGGGGARARENRA